MTHAHIVCFASSAIPSGNPDLTTIIQIQTVIADSLQCTYNNSQKVHIYFYTLCVIIINRILYNK